MKKLYIGALVSFIAGAVLSIWGWKTRGSVYLDQYSDSKSCWAFRNPSTQACGAWDGSECIKGTYDPVGLSICMPTDADVTTVKHAGVAILLGIVLVIISGVLGFIGYSVK